jgi:ABC-type multidrug transport system ATPase subunit
MASGMDPQGWALFRREARAAVQRGRTIIYSTQMIEVAERFSDRVMVLSEGQLRAFAPVVDLVTTSGQGLEELLVNLRDRS